jgi:ankyrin repeat protein
MKSNNSTAYSITDYFSNPRQYDKLNFSAEIDISELGANSRTITHYVARYGNKEMLEYLVNKYGEGILSVKDEYNISLLHYAARYGDKEMLEYLMQYDLDLRSEDTTSRHIVHYAAGNEKEDVLVYFIECAKEQGKLIDLHAVDKFNRNAVHYAAYYRCNNSIKYLADQGVDLNSIETTDGYTPMHLAAYQDNADVLETLFSVGVKVDNSRDDIGKTTLGKAAFHGNTASLEILLQNGADPNEVDKDGSILHNAAGSNNLETVQALVKNEYTRVNLNVLNKNRETAIYNAINVGNLEIVKFLLESGVNTCTSNVYGQTPLYSAKQWNHLDIAQYLEEEMLMDKDYGLSLVGVENFYE